MLESEEELRAVEKSIHEAYFGSDPKCLLARRSAREFFRRICEEGYNISIRLLIGDLAEKGKLGQSFDAPFTFLDHVHPRAWDVILKYGRDYTPVSLWKRGIQHDEHQPKSRSCFLNTYEQMKFAHETQSTSKITYVEGFALGPSVDPMLHAWNGVGFSKRALDWTFYATAHWNCYFGVPFTLAEYNKIIASVNPDRPMIKMLFRKDKFEGVEDCIHEVLQKSRKRFYRA